MKVGEFRCGNHQRRNFYVMVRNADGTITEEPVGCTYSEEDGPVIVDMLNNREHTVLSGWERKLLTMVDDGEPCDYDHNGECQMHGRPHPDEAYNCVYSQIRALLSVHEDAAPVADEAPAYSIEKPTIIVTDGELVANEVP